MKAFLTTLGPGIPESELLAEEKRRRAQEKRDAAVGLIRVALRKHKIKDWDAASPATKRRFITEVKDILASLEVPDTEEEE